MQFYNFTRLFDFWKAELSEKRDYYQALYINIYMIIITCLYVNDFVLFYNENGLKLHIYFIDM